MVPSVHARQGAKFRCAEVVVLSAASVRLSPSLPIVVMTALDVVMLEARTVALGGAEDQQAEENQSNRRGGLPSTLEIPF